MHTGRPVNYTQRASPLPSGADGSAQRGFVSDIFSGGPRCFIRPCGVSRSSIKRAISPSPVAASRLHELPPGEEAQVDFFYVGPLARPAREE